MATAPISIDTDRDNTLRLLKQIRVLTMSRAERVKLLKFIGRGYRDEHRQNIRQQRTITGEAMKPRAKRSRRKMFRKMAKGMKITVNGSVAVVTWKNAGQAKVAYRHHHGIPESFTASKAEKVYGVPDYAKPATHAQAKALNQEGYRRPVARKRGKGGAILKRVSQKWIRQNMTIGQAGLILRMMRTGTTKGKQRWTIKTPERPTLGADPAHTDKHLVAMANDALARMKQV